MSRHQINKNQSSDWQVQVPYIHSFLTDIINVWNIFITYKTKLKDPSAQQVQLAKTTEMQIIYTHQYHPIQIFQ